MSDEISRKHELKTAPSGSLGAVRRKRTIWRSALFLLPALAGEYGLVRGADTGPAAGSPAAGATPAASPVGTLPAGAPESGRAAWERRHSIAFSRTPLTQAVALLASTSGMTVVLDRRVDPDRPITLGASDLPLGQIWADLAAEAELGVSWVGPVVYLGPPDAAAKLRTLSALRRAEAALLPPDLRAAVTAKKTVQWDDVAEPQSLWSLWTSEAGLKPSDPGLPHDLRPGALWPPLSLIDRLTLLAVQFDRTFAIDPATRTAKPLPIPAAPVIERSHPAPPGAAETVRRWQGLAPQASIRQSGDRLVVVGREEDHEAIASGRARPAAAVKPAVGAKGGLPAGKQTFRLRARNIPLSRLIADLRRQGSDVRFDAEALKQAGVDLERLISVEVDGATLVELLETAGKPLGLTARSAGDAVELVPRP